ncbi:hypothetical protein KGA66_07895 [Actinocrinis puniceicyclus]|uniref:Lipoprotein n=1 Tax=Actinocrinis puniceicyclus TaxID=977794 RepID=A0A8J8BCC1_9ACTN|nr:hypothetical protein [Actinocrinis puniceicyclus]MBS2962961.1 hypothetical protein [Actinocrinis puniceicyclus]
MGLLVGALLLATGCGTASGTRTAHPEQPATLSDSDQLAQAQDVMTGECMRARGFDYTVMPRPAHGTDPLEFPYGLDDVAWARANGYGFAQRAALGAAQHDNPNARYVQRLTSGRRTAYVAAMFGSKSNQVSVTVPNGDVVVQNTDGCLAAAERRLYGDFVRWFRDQTIAGNLEPAIEPKVFADPRYLAAQRAWSACVRTRGYPAAGPADLESQAAAAGPEAARKIATIDATCDIRTKLAATGRALDIELGAPVRAEYRSVIDDYAALQRAALPRAAAIARGTP